MLAEVFSAYYITSLQGYGISLGSIKKKPEPPFFPPEREEVRICLPLKNIKMVGKKNAKMSKTNSLCFDAKHIVWTEVQLKHEAES